MKKATPLTLLFALLCFSVDAQRYDGCVSFYFDDGYDTYTTQQVVPDDLGYYVVLQDQRYLIGKYDWYLARYNRFDEEVWRVRLGPDGMPFSGIFPAAGNAVYFVSGTNVVKYGADGTVLLSIFTEDGHDATLVQEDASGNIMIAGNYWDGTRAYIAVSSYTQAKALRWSTKLIVPANAYYNAVQYMKILANGSVLVSGSTGEQLTYGLITSTGGITFNLNVNKISNNSVQNFGMAVATDGYYFLTQQYKADGTADLYLYKMNLNGSIARSSKITTPYNYNQSGSLVVIENVNPVISYTSINYADFTQKQAVTTKFTSAGAVSWTSVKNGGDTNGSKTDDSNNIYVAGYNRFLKLSPTGAIVDEIINDVYAIGYIAHFAITPRGDAYFTTQGCGLRILKNCPAISITTNIGSKNVCLGAATTDLEFVVNALAPIYQWTRNGQVINDGDEFGGTKTSKLTIKSMAYEDVGAYVCKVTDNCLKTTTSATANITLTTPLSITTHPTSKAICTGTPTSLTVAATGGTNLKYQWTRNGVNMNDAGGITGTKTATLNFSTFGSSDVANYVCVVTNDCNVSVSSSTAALTLIPAAQITRAPVAQAGAEGLEANFTIEASGAGLTYQWKFNTANLSNNTHYSGVTTPVLNIKGLTCTDVGQYTCTVTSTCGSPVTSTAVALTVTSDVTITQHPVSQQVCTGGTGTLSVQATGTGVTYSWRKGTTVLADGGKYAGTKTATLTVSGATATEAGSYNCIVQRPCSAAKTSDAATIDLISPPSIVSQTASKTYCEGETVQLTLNLSAGSYTYQWFKGGVALTNTSSITGVTASSLFISNISAADAGSYACKATGCGGVSVTSAAIGVTISAKVAITSQPVANSACDGDDVSLTVAATGSSPSYQWLKSGVALTNTSAVTGVNTSTLVIKGVDAGLHQGFYSCKVSGTCGPSATSNIVLVVVNPKPDLFLLEANDCFENGATAITDLVGDREDLAGVFKIYRENSNIQLSAISEEGNYDIIKTTDANCSDKVTVPIGCIVTGVENEVEQVTVSPNPSKGVVNLQSVSGFVRYEVLNAIGVRVHSGDVGRQQQQIDLNFVPGGYYLLVLHGRNGEKELHKLIISK